MTKGDDEIKKRDMPFLDHLEELRWRILKALIAVVVGSGAAMAFSDTLLDVIMFPVAHLENSPDVIALTPMTMIMVRLSIAVAAGLVFAVPVILYQGWAFITPGLLGRERRYAFPIILAGTLCFLLGAGLAYLIVPMVLAALIQVSYEGVKNTWNIQDYIGFVLRFMVAFGVVFELPVISFFLSKIGLLTPAFMRHYRKHAIVASFILAALLTPPDPYTQIAMALPLLILYQVSIWVAMIAAPKTDRPDKPAKES